MRIKVQHFNPSVTQHDLSHSHFPQPQTSNFVLKLTPMLYTCPNLSAHYPIQIPALIHWSWKKNPEENNENYSKVLKILLYPTSKIPSLSLIPYTPWSTAGGVPVELRGDPHSSSDHRKTTLLIPRCLATGGKNHADDHRRNRMKQRRSTTGCFRKNNPNYNNILTIKLWPTK